MSNKPVVLSAGVLTETTTPRVSALLDASGDQVIVIDGAASAVNAFFFVAASTGNSPQLYATGSDTNIGFNVYPKGSGAINLADSNGAPVLLTDSVGAGAVNYVRVRNSSTGNAPTVYVAGSDTNANLALQGAGAGVPIANVFPVQLVQSASATVPANYGAYFPDQLEISAGVAFEVGSGAVVEVG